MPFTVTQSTLVHIMTLSLGTVMQLVIRQSLSLLVMPMLITRSGSSQSLLLIDIGVMLLICAICQVVSSWCVVPLALLHGNRLDLVMTDVPDIVDVVVGTPLGTSDHCIVSCVLLVEQYVPQYSVRSMVFLKHHSNWVLEHHFEV